jgi:phosphoribosylformylglycinamidine synthase subunit PurS
MKIVVDVMLKPEIADPQGEAIGRALPTLGFTGVAGVRQGKRFELALEAGIGPGEAHERATKIAETLLANPVIEDFTVRVEER